MLRDRDGLFRWASQRLGMVLAVKSGGAEALADPAGFFNVTYKAVEAEGLTEEFIRTHHRAVVAVRRAGGGLQMSPVSVGLQDGHAVISSRETAFKVKALRRDPRVSLCVDLEERPYGFVQVQGRAELSEKPAELVRTATAIAVRYMGRDRAEEFGKRNGVPGELVVRVRPDKVITAFNMTG